MSIGEVFKEVILLRKSDRLPPPSGSSGLPTAATASDIRLDRRFAFRFDARAPKWDLKVLRIKEIVTFSFFSFFTSGGEFSDVPSENDNSPRA